MDVVSRLNGERVVLLGWSRAILLQLAHPLVAAGVAQHSTFRGGVLEAAVRLHHTVGAMLALTFGDAARHAEAIGRIRAIHRMVHGTLPAAAGRFPAGTRYSANDPALLLWVHATLLDSTLDMYQRLVAPLTPADADAYCAGALPVLIELGGDADGAPTTAPALAAYMQAMYTSGTLHVTPEAREIGHAVLSPRAAGWRVPVGGLNRLVAVGTLPAAVRDQYGFAWDEPCEARLTRTLRRLRTARRVAPALLARWPHAR